MTPINLTTGDSFLRAEINDRELSREFLALMPMTLTLRRWDNKEYFSVIEPVLTERLPVTARLRNQPLTLIIQKGVINLLLNETNNTVQSDLILIGDILPFEDTASLSNSESPWQVRFSLA
ncbi:MAG: cyclophilin-like fold protein [Rouxiella aceris]|uniref:cyclophilin-like fold protein n=1 Tax=Rouxiella aceris TaxID=2703884 RepID=UPI0028521783|nr:cyclophilin-like fold protein [Rouxiella aceris]MDR3434712.1 cyclophilin-like fold protein [Rouxiella aceris]